MKSKSSRSRYGFIAFVAAVVVFRFMYSLTTEFWFPDEDVLQIYLIGLKSFTTGSYPYFGADIVYTHVQIPGALQGYIVSAMWYVWKIPEAPYILLNILLDLSLGFFAWYASKRLADVPKLFIWAYVFLISWSVGYFTKLVNPSHVIPAAILFFIGIFEIYPRLRTGIISRGLAFYFLGFALVWIFQLHISWVLLGPFIAIAFFYELRAKNVRRLLTSSVYFILGCLTSGLLLIPTLLKYGLSDPNGTKVTSLVQLHFEHLADAFKYLSTYFAYASFDVTRFIGGDTAARMAFLRDYPWAAPFTVVVGIIGIGHALFLLYSFFRSRRSDPYYSVVRNLAVFAFVLLWLSTAFSNTEPASHASVLFFPLVMLYSMYVLRDLLKKKWMQRLAIGAFVSAVVMYSAIAMKNYGAISIYTNYSPLVRALNEKDYTLVGLRRYEKTDSLRRN